MSRGDRLTTQTQTLWSPFSFTIIFMSSDEFHEQVRVIVLTFIHLQFLKEDSVRSGRERVLVIVLNTNVFFQFSLKAGRRQKQ